jgi:long-chain acyl-CoA synthetase
MTTTSNPTSANIARWVTERAATDPNLPALRQGEQILTYSDLQTASARFATILRGHGVEPGDRIAMIMPNVAYFPIVYYAMLRVGAIVVPMNPLLKAGEISFVWNDCSVKIAVVFPLFAEEAAKAASLTGTETILTVPGEFDAELARTDPTEEVAESTRDETAVILYTSGTTGQPKGAELTHANLSSNAHTMIETLIPMGPGDMVFGGFAVVPLLRPAGPECRNGRACMTLLSKFDGEQALSIVSSDRVTVFAGVPTMYMGLLAVKNRERFDTSALRAAVSGGASLPVEVLHRVEQAFGITLLEGYGLSETSPVASFNHPDRPTKPGSIGTPIRGVEFGLRDEDDKEVADGEIGEIVIRGENVMKGYWNKPEATEEILYAHPAVAEAAVFGVPDAMCGEEVAALVTLKDGASATDGRRSIRSDDERHRPKASCAGM